MSEEIKKGLLGIVVDETTISHVVPELSALTYRGYKVQDLCDKCDFEEVAYLVLHGELPSKSQLKKFIKEERSNRKLYTYSRRKINSFINFKWTNRRRGFASRHGLFYSSWWWVSIFNWIYYILWKSTLE